MYDNNNFETDLINSYAWDTAIEFIQNFSGDIDYSQQTSLEQNMILKTGALKNTTSNDNDDRCNIYDMAGNVSEWTTETYVDEENPCTHRGGWYLWAEGKTANRFARSISDMYDGSVGFRTIIYICQ